MSVFAAVSFLMMQAGVPLVDVAPPENETIVVVGRRLEDTGPALSACIARRCPAKEDIARSLAHAQAQLVAGDYKGSRRTLLAARGRNKDQAADLPVDVADLHRANARLASLTGLRDASRAGIFDVVDALKAGLDDEDARILEARLEVGAAFAREGRLRAATDEYDAVARYARQRGQKPVEGLALFQKATLLTTIATLNSIYRNQAEKVASVIEASSEPSWGPFRDALRIVPAVLAPEKDRPRLLDEAVSGMTLRPVDEPFLLYSPRPDFSRFSGGPDTEWVDLHYRIAQNGTVVGATAVRQSDGAAKAWIAAAQKALENRRYAPQQLAADALGPVRTERVTFVSDLIFEKGSRIRGRARRRVDNLDLTVSADAPPTAFPTRSN